MKQLDANTNVILNVRSAFNNMQIVVNRFWKSLTKIMHRCKLKKNKLSKDVAKLNNKLRKYVFYLFLRPLIGVVPPSAISE